MGAEPARQATYVRDQVVALAEIEEVRGPGRVADLFLVGGVDGDDAVAEGRGDLDAEVA